MYSTFPTRPAIVTGRALAHAERTAVAKAFLVIDAANGSVTLKPTIEQLCNQVGVSRTYANAAKRVATNPQLRARVEAGQISLMDAAKAMGPVRNKPTVSELTQADFVEMFGAVGKATRGVCFRAFAGEALTAIEEVTTPTGNGARKFNAADLGRWKAREQKKQDPDFIALMREHEAKNVAWLEKLQPKIAKEEANPDWRYKALTRMTELATQRLRVFANRTATWRRGDWCLLLLWQNPHRQIVARPRHRPGMHQIPAHV
jgi:hypothetical protein